MCSEIPKTIIFLKILLLLFSCQVVSEFVTQWNAACQASLLLTMSSSSPKFLSIESVMPSNHLILCCPLLLLPSIFPSIRVFSNESAPHIRWPKYRSFSFSLSPSNEYSGLITFKIDWFDLVSKWLSRSSSSTTFQKHHMYEEKPKGWIINGINRKIAIW